MTWQPIETAPKDGTKFLYFDKEVDGGIAVGFFSNGKLMDDIYNLVMYGATHWMPMPDKPTM